MYKKTWKVLAAFTLAIIIGFSGTASAEVDISKFNSAVSVELGKSADMNTLYQRADQIYDVVEHDDSHIIWKFTGTTGDYAFIFADGRLAVCGMANFNLPAKDTLEKELNDLIDLIDTIAGVTQDEREEAVDHATYYANDAGIYQRIKYKYDREFNLDLSVPECTVKKARLTISGAHYYAGPPASCKSIYNIDGETIATSGSCNWNTPPTDITKSIPSGKHEVESVFIERWMLSGSFDSFSKPLTMYIEAYTTPATKKMVFYSDDYKTWIEDTTQSLTLDHLPEFISGAAPRDTNAGLPTISIEPESLGDKLTASVHLHGEKTDVVLGEDILLILSAVNKITNPTMTLQVILIPPSGMSVTSADFVESGAGQYTSTYVIEPGKGRDIEVGIRSNQVGDFVVNGEVIYFFEGEEDKPEEHTLSLPIKVRESSSPTPTPTHTHTPSSDDGKGIPGFEAMFAAAGLLLIIVLIKRGG